MQAERSNNDSFRDVHVCQCFQLNFILNLGKRHLH